MDNIKVGDLYLSKSKLDDIVQLVAKKRHIKNYQNKLSSIKWTVLAHFLTPNFKLKNLRHDNKKIFFFYTHT